MRIRAFSRMTNGPGYYRLHLPLGELERHGHDITIEGAATHRTRGGADVVIGQMIGHDTNPERVCAWWDAMARRGPVVYEMDDDVFTVDPKSPAYSAYGYAQESLRYCLSRADLVTVSTGPLGDVARKLNPNVAVLPNYVDEAMLEIKRPRRDDGKLVIGWAGSATHAPDIAECAYGWRKTLDHNPDVVAHMVGADFRKVLGTRHKVQLTKWAESTAAYYQLLDFDIGLAPVAPTVFNRSKSYVKCLEYGCLGIPVLASAFCPYEDYVVDGVTGFLIRRPAQWARRLRDLVNDEAMRTEMGAKARELAARHTIQTHWPQWEIAYRTML